MGFQQSDYLANLFISFEDTVEEAANKYAEGVGELQPGATPQGRRAEGGQNAESVGESRVRLSLANAFSVAKTGYRLPGALSQAEMRQRLRRKTASLRQSRAYLRVSACSNRDVSIEKPNCPLILFSLIRPVWFA